MCMAVGQPGMALLTIDIELTGLFEDIPVACWGGGAAESSIMTM